MADIYCKKCNEPYDGYGLASDMGRTKAQAFLAGKGCPSCAFGTQCVACHGTKTKQLERYEDGYCSYCSGTGRVLIRRLAEERYPGDLLALWHANEGGSNVRIYEADDLVVTEVRRYETADGWASEGWATCSGCRNNGPVCEECGGTGELVVDEEQELERQERFLWSLVDGTDRDPFEFLGAV